MHKVDWIKANDVWLRYAEEGLGNTTIVLIHELGGTLDSWDYILPELAQNYRVLRYDLRGFGLSQKVHGDFTLDDAVDDLVGFIEAMNITGPIVLVGAAIGAGIAMRVAAQYPQIIDALIALSPATEIEPERLEAAKKFPEMINQLGLSALVEASLETVFPTELRTDPVIYSRFRAQQACADPEGYIAAYQMLINGSFKPFLPDIKCPTLVAAGQYDRIRPPEMVKCVADLIPKAIYKSVPSGHFMAIQTPKIANKLISEGLKSAGL